MRRCLFAAALGALLTILVAAPAGAVPPNEVLMARHLAELGVIPSYATAEMASSTVRTVYGSGPNYELKSPLVQRTLSGKQTSLGRFLGQRADDPGATRTYTTKTLVLLVEFGDDPWPAGSPAPTGPMTPGPAHGAIPAPAADDNATFWPGDFSPMHYQQELFGNSYPIYDATGRYRGQQRLDDAQLVPRAVTRHLHGRRRHRRLGQARHARVVVRRRQRPRERHRRPHRPGVARRPRRRRQVRRREPRLPVGRLRQ